MATHEITLTDEQELDLQHCQNEFTKTAEDTLLVFIVPALESHRPQRIAEENAAIVAAVRADPKILEAVKTAAPSLKISVVNGEAIQ